MFDAIFHQQEDGAFPSLAVVVEAGAIPSAAELGGAITVEGGGTGTVEGGGTGAVECVASPSEVVMEGGAFLSSAGAVEFDAIW